MHVTIVAYIKLPNHYSLSGTAIATRCAYDNVNAHIAQHIGDLGNDIIPKDNKDNVF